MSLSERLSQVIRTAGVSPRSVAEVVGVHYTTIYRIVKADDPKLMRVVEARLTGVVLAMEELIEAGKLPFGKHRGLAQKDEPAALRALIEENK